MKLLNALALLLLLVPCIARADHIGIYSDQAGASCLLSNPVPPPGVNSFYVIHKFSVGRVASQFRIDDATGLTPFAQTSPFLPVGTWNVDLSIAYGECLVGSFIVMTLDFLWLGTPLPTNCNHLIEVLPAPTSPLPGDIVVVDCAQPVGNVYPATGNYSVYGPLACGPYCTVGTEESTWGSVKALYR